MKLAEAQETMQKTVEATQRSFNTIRTGRANASLLDKVQVEYYYTNIFEIPGKHYHARFFNHPDSALR